MDVFAKMPDLLQHLAGVVDGSVIGALLDDRHPDRALALPGIRALQARMGPQLGPYSVLVEGIPINWPDHAETVPVGLQIDRDRAGDEQGAVVIGFVVVA